MMRVVSRGRVYPVGSWSEAVAVLVRLHPLFFVRVLLREILL